MNEQKAHGTQEPEGQAGPSGEVAEGSRDRTRADSAKSVRFPTPPGADHRSLAERIDALDQRLGGEVARLRDSVENHSLHLLGKAIEALTSLEADWVRQHAEADALREKLREATLTIGELQLQLDRIGGLRNREATATLPPEEMQEQLAQARQELELAREAQRTAEQWREAAERECLQLQQRISWRVMAPLRYIRSLFPKIRL